MQVTSDSELWGWLVILLAPVATGVSWLAHKIPSSLGKGPGGVLVAIGVFNVLLHRRLGRQISSRSQSMPPLVARFWNQGGERGAQLLYLGIGIILVVAGGVLLIRSE